jgi:hypothetical protein
MLCAHHCWPGKIFEQPDLDYAEAMQAYVAATRERLSRPKSEKVAQGGRKAKKQALRRAEEALRERRYQVRERRKQEDAAWRTLRKQFKSDKRRFIRACRRQRAASTAKLGNCAGKLPGSTVG